ncbi:tRNA lysidine(34) synthetase TilS [Desulfurivibrio alkaliphilus]|uniref:tRNA(Ile)-lysidine synthase n=1 Tax=Desulfurivibrio alkaliphilus (strain DSM 19089 / UNIQEM U267 / AHT2) TaxID=589865 RepID=D6YZR7_DESAT|nr:tRNA lysidine(34) synthetase TilS [Desulfurivibrio alkaliphilus]ADH85074.1 tRNA(Ile)-lysidine synthetase [Desulfurivibrio alkaliphilus AHT 2]
MHPLEKKVKKSIAGHRLIAAGELVVVGTSGGPDSMALLYALKTLSAAMHFNLLAVYVDHGLRPEESREEEQLMAAVAAALEIPWRGGRVAVRDYARQQGLSLEHAARELRYRFFAQVAAETGAAKIAVAHTADDQAEELLLRLLRGTARGGLSGMAPLARGRIIRPLLAVSKAEVLAYLAQRNIAFARDSSNQDLRFVRNRVRLELVPWLKQRFNPRLRETLCHTATVLQDEEELLAAMADEAYRQARVAGEPAKAALTLSLPFFAAQPRALQRRLLEMALLELQLKPAGRQIEQLLHGADRGGKGVIGHLAGGVTVYKDAKSLRFHREAPGPRRRPPASGKSTNQP